MDKKIIFVNGEMYIFAFSNKNITVFNYNGNYKKINLNTKEDFDLHIENIVVGIVQIVGEELLNKIKNNMFISEEEIKNEFLNSLKKFNIDNQNIYYETFKAYEDKLEELNSAFQKQNDNAKQKEEIIEEKLNVDLKTIFQDHGINEFEITDTKSAITYEKNGIPYVITHTNPDTNIYEEVLRSLDFDKLNSKEQLDMEIDNSFEREKDRFTEHKTETTYNSFDNNIEEITDFLRKNYGINEIYDVMPSNDNTIGESLLVDYGNGWQLLTIERDINGIITSVKLGTRKNIDNEKNTSLGVQDLKTENLEDELSNQAITNQIKGILLKLYQNKELSEEDKKVIEKNKIESNFYTLPPEAQQMFREISELYQNLQIELNPEIEKNEEKGRAYKIEPPKKEDKNAFIEIGIVTFLSGIITGILVYAFFIIFV